MTVPRLPVGNAFETLFAFTIEHFQALFGVIAVVVEFVNRTANQLLMGPPAWVNGAVLAAVMWRVAGRTPAAFTALAVLLLLGLDLWPQTMATLALMATAVILTLAVGIPLGIAAAHSDLADALLTPLLDFLQTMPPFIFLIPAVIMFGIGPVPAVLATVLYALPVPIRLTNVGLRQVEKGVLEAAAAFGLTPLQLLLKVKLPLALPVILTGVNQTIMLSLGMVIIAAMIGAGGLGAEVVRGIVRLQLGTGFEAGLAVVIVAMVLDRLGRGLTRTAFGSGSHT